MSFTNMHNDYLDPDRAGLNDEPACDECVHDTGRGCSLGAGACTFKPREASAFDTQVGGNHYNTMVIQPIQYIHLNGIGFVEGSVIKYVSRWRAKGGIEDIRKARHLLDMLIELEGLQNA